MPRIQNSIIIREQPRKVFEIINDIERWPHLFNEYHGSESVRAREEGRYTKIVFQLTNEEGNTWRSARLLDNRELVRQQSAKNPCSPLCSCI